MYGPLHPFSPAGHGPKHLHATDWHPGLECVQRASASCSNTPCRRRCCAAVRAKPLVTRVPSPPVSMGDYSSAAAPARIERRGRNCTCGGPGLF